MFQFSFGTDEDAMEMLLEKFQSKILRIRRCEMKLAGIGPAS